MGRQNQANKRHKKTSEGELDKALKEITDSVRSVERDAETVFGAIAEEPQVQKSFAAEIADTLAKEEELKALFATTLTTINKEKQAALDFHKTTIDNVLNEHRESLRTLLVQKH